MAKFELNFIDCVNPDFRLTIGSTAYFTEEDNNLRVIDIEIFIDGNDGMTFSMDVSTAIKVAKTLRTEINKITESEVNNG
jgi:hypothetical protein